MISNKKIISLLLPTRGRQIQVNNFFRNIINTTSDLDRLEVILYIDNDDYESYQLDCKNFAVHRIIGPKLSMGAYNSACLEIASGDIIMLVNDDIHIKTKGWDNQIRAVDEMFKDKIYLCYPNDLHKKSHLCTFPVISRNTYNLLIKPYPIEYQRFFIDTHIFDIFQRLKFFGFDRIFYCGNVIFEHRHYRIGKSSYDETYRLGNKKRFDDDLTFLNFIELRSYSAKRLLFKICNLSVSEDLGEVLKISKPISNVSLNFGQAIIFFCKKLLMDKELSFQWKFYLWFRFVSRYIVKNTFLSRLMR